MSHILFVCTGNTCRSPMAEGICRLALQGRSDIIVSSAGVAAYPGDRASKETLDVLRTEFQTTLADFSSRPVSRDILEQSTHIFAMTEGHLRSLLSQFPEFQEKYFLTCEFLDDAPDVPDPIGQGKRAYQETASILNEAIPKILAFIDQSKA